MLFDLVLKHGLNPERVSGLGKGGREKGPQSPPGCRLAKEMAIPTTQPRRGGCWLHAPSLALGRTRGDLKGAVLLPPPWDSRLETQVLESMECPRVQGPFPVLRGKWHWEGGMDRLVSSFPTQGYAFQHLGAGGVEEMSHL